MTKSDFYAQHQLVPDTGTVVNSWGAIQTNTGKHLFQCWDNEKTFIKKADRVDDVVMVVKLLSPEDLQIQGSGARARLDSIESTRQGAIAFVAVSTGKYPNWIDAANLSQVYPVLAIYEENGEIFAKVGSPLAT